MARQKGLVVLNGTIGDLNFYVREGEALVRKAGGGFTSKAIKNKPSMIRVRENSSEFGGCMVATKHFKIAIVSLLCLFKDGKRHQRLAQLFTQIKDCDSVSERGKRNVGSGILTDEGKAKLAGYVISSRGNLFKLLHQHHSFEWDMNGFVINNFSSSDVNFPKGATHLEVIVGWLVFDFGSYDYSFYKSDRVLVGTDYTEPILQIAPTVLPEGLGSRVGLVFLRFIENINGVNYPLKAIGDTALEVVFVG